MHKKKKRPFAHPYCEAGNGAAHRNYRRTALPPPEGMSGEDDMGQGNLATRPLDPQVESVLPRSEEVDDLGPHSPDSRSSSLMPYGMGEDSCSGKSQDQQDQTLEQMEAEEERNLPVEEATSRLRMGLHVGPANYQPASPKYIRADEEEEEEEEEDEDIEAPYLAPRDTTRAKSYPEDDLQSISSGSLPDLIDLEEEEPPYQPLTSTGPGNAIRPATLVLNKATAGTLTEKYTPSTLSPEKPEGICTPVATQERPVAKEGIPEEDIIHIDDDSEPSPLAKMEAQVDRLLMPPPVDNTLIAAGTLLALSQVPPKYTKADSPQHHSSEKKRNGAVGKKLQDRRKAKSPLN